MKSENVVILGASPKPERYAYKAMKRLQEHGHKTLLVNPGLTTIENQSVYASLKDLSAQSNEAIDTLTVYVKQDITLQVLPDILEMNPKRVIFNPGTENSKVASELSAAGIEVVEGCTLVMLSTKQF